MHIKNLINYYFTSYQKYTMLKLNFTPTILLAILLTVLSCNTSDDDNNIENVNNDEIIKLTT